VARGSVTDEVFTKFFIQTTEIFADLRGKLFDFMGQG